MRMVLGVRMVIELTIIIIMMVLAGIAFCNWDKIKEYYYSLIPSTGILSPSEALVEKDIFPDDTADVLRSIGNLRVNAQEATEVSSQATGQPAAKLFRYRKETLKDRVVANRQTNKYIPKDVIVVTVPGNVKLRSLEYEQRMKETKEKINIEYGPLPVKVRHPSIKGYIDE